MTVARSRGKKRKNGYEGKDSNTVHCYQPIIHLLNPEAIGGETGIMWPSEHSRNSHKQGALGNLGIIVRIV